MRRRSQSAESWSNRAGRIGGRLLLELGRPLDERRGRLLRTEEPLEHAAAHRTSRFPSAVGASCTARRNPHAHSRGRRPPVRPPALRTHLSRLARGALGGGIGVSPSGGFSSVKRSAVPNVGAMTVFGPYLHGSAHEGLALRIRALFTARTERHRACAYGCMSE